MLKSILLAPWWLIELFTSAKSFRDNPLIGSRRLNRLGLHRWRLRLAHHLTARRRRRLAGLVTAADRAAFERDGYVVHRDLLPPAVFDTLRARLLAHGGAAREMQQGDTITRRIAVDDLLLRQVPELRALIDEPRWSGLTRYVAGYGRAPWLYVQTILNRVTDDEPDPQTRLHADTFHPTMKAWFFLTDVPADQGAFCYVPGSHRLTPARLAWESAKSLSAARGADRLSARGSLRVDEGELPGLGLPAPMRLAVPANTLVVADTFGFHARGPSSGPSIRIELWGYDRRNPFLPGSTDGLLAALGLTDRRAPLYWGLLDRLERWGAGRNPWRDCGVKTPGEPAVRAPAGATVSATDPG